MDLGIAGRRAVVIGGSKGLGLASAERLAQEGVNLVLFARDPVLLEQTRQRLQERYGVQVDTCAGDIVSAPDVDRLAATCAAGGGVQILVLNTPGPPSAMRDLLDETDQGRWDQAYQQQLHGALLILRKVTPLLVAAGWGRVVAITSASIKQPMVKHALSSVFRAGVQSALKHLAMELADKGVTVNSVAPATVITERFRNIYNLEQRVASVPMKRGGRPEELAATVAFLASEHAGYITGENIQMDGGATRSLV